MSEHGEEIEKAIQMMPYIRRLFGEEAFLGVSTLEQLVFYEKGKHLDIGIRLGEQTQEGTGPDRVMKTGRPVVERVPRDVFGVAFVGTTIPVVEDGRVVGAITMGQPVEVEERLQEMAGKMNSSVESVSGGASGFAASAQELAATSSELAGNTDKIRHDVKDMDTIISLIMEIASQTHLLGLNAAIEAARAGDMGRGFNVVAEEIRKLAGRTQTSAKEVTEKLNRIKDNIDALAEHVLQASSVAEEQAATSQAISTGIQELEPIAQDLINVSAELVK